MGPLNFTQGAFAMMDSLRIKERQTTIMVTVFPISHILPRVFPSGILEKRWIFFSVHKDFTQLTGSMLLKTLATECTFSSPCLLSD